MYTFREDDIFRLLTACELYKQQTGSEFIWEQYNTLTEKLKLYLEQNFPDGREKNV